MRKRFIIICFFVFCFLSLPAYSFYSSKYDLTTSKYVIQTDKIIEDFRVVQLSDLHDSQFGEENEELIHRVDSEKPDLILLTGDLVNDKTGEDTSIATDLIQNLSNIAPVYFSYGNQEQSLEDNYSVDIRQLYTDAGAHVLEREYTDIDINGQTIRLGGIYGYCQSEFYAIETHREDETAFLKDFQNTDNYKILLCHMPVCWLSGSLYDWDVDCVFAGHVHGGQIRIPWIGGLYAPDQGWFPGQVAGVYSTSEEDWKNYQDKMLSFAKEQNKNGASYDLNRYKDAEYEPSYLVLSRGLGSTESIPRLNNIPEIVVVDFVPDEE